MKMIPIPCFLMIFWAATSAALAEEDSTLPAYDWEYRGITIHELIQEDFQVSGAARSDASVDRDSNIDFIYLQKGVDVYQCRLVTNRKFEKHGHACFLLVVTRKEPEAASK